MVVDSFRALASHAMEDHHLEQLNRLQQHHCQFHHSNNPRRVVTVVMTISMVVFTGMSWNVPQVCSATHQNSSNSH
jgi:hypothetical protein